MKTQCPHCKARFNVDEKFTGKQAKCPKCGKPFIIEPLMEQPVAIETPVAVEPPPKSAEPVEPPARSTTPIAPPAKSPEPIATPAKIVESVAPPVKSPEPIELPVPASTAKPSASPRGERGEKSAVPVAIPAKSVEPVKPPVKSAEAIAATSAEPARLARLVSGESRRVKGEKPKAKALSKTVFVYCWMAVRIIAGIFGVLGLMMVIRKGAHSTLIAAFAAADVFLILSVLIELALFYKMWAAIQDDQASISPAKAVGLLFIPVFNIYWALLMVTGFVEDYNAFIHRRSVKTKDLPFTLFLIYAFAFILAATVLTTPMICVFAFVGRISGAFNSYPFASWVLLFVAFAAGIAHFISYILFAFKTCNAINALSDFACASVFAKATPDKTPDRPERKGR
jgi:predicted Zn finger-like uncharacterized protein